MTPQAQDYLNKANCGFQGRDPKVCCELSESGGGGGGSTVTEVVTKNPSTTTGGNCFALSHSVVSFLTTKSVITDLYSNLLPSVNECGTLSADRIVGGKEANLDEFPWMALVQYQKSMFLFSLL